MKFQFDVYEFWVAIVDQTHAAIMGFQSAIFLWEHVSFMAKILIVLVPCILTYVNVWIIIMYFILIQTSETFLVHYSFLQDS